MQRLYIKRENAIFATGKLHARGNDILKQIGNQYPLYGHVKTDLAQGARFRKR